MVAIGTGNNSRFIGIAPACIQNSFIGDTPVLERVTSYISSVFGGAAQHWMVPVRLHVPRRSSAGARLGPGQLQGSS